MGDKLARRMLRTWYLLAVACAAGCGTPARVGYLSGSRLRARVLDVGGARAFVGFHDRKLDIDCSFRLATDGVVRCLPDVSVGLAYADPACSTVVGQLVEAACSTSTPKYAVFRQSSCNTRTPTDTYYAIGAPVMSTVYAAPYCKPLGALDHFFAVTPVPPSTFVAGSERLEPHGSLGSRVVVGDDGSRATVGVYDVARGRACAPTDLYDGGPKRCLPLNQARLGGLFADAQCTQPVAQANPDCDAPELIVEYPELACSSPTMFAVASQADLSTVYSGIGCVTTQVSRGDYYLPGRELGPDAFPALVDVAVGSGAARVGAFGDVSGAALDFGSGFLVLAKSQRTCQPARDGHGVLRCVDDAAAEIDGRFFSDAACTQPVAVIETPCATPPAPYIVRWGNGDCAYPGIPAIAGLFAAGAAVGTPSYLTGTSCTTQSGVQAYEIGDALDVASLPVVQALVE